MTSPDNCLFCRIARGEIPSHVVYQSERLFAFLDIHPVRAGHVLIIPREHVDYFDELPADTAAEIMSIAQKLAPLMRSHFQAKQVAFLFLGTDIAHAHAHVVPMVEPGDITSRSYIREEKITFQQAAQMPDDKLAGIASRLAGGLANAEHRDCG